MYGMVATRTATPPVTLRRAAAALSLRSVGSEVRTRWSTPGAMARGEPVDRGEADEKRQPAERLAEAENVDDDGGENQRTERDPDDEGERDDDFLDPVHASSSSF